MCSGAAKTGNAKDKGRGHDGEKEGEEEEERTSRGRASEKGGKGVERDSYIFKSLEYLEFKKSITAFYLIQFQYYIFS